MKTPILYLVFIVVATLLISCEKEVDPTLLPVVSTTDVGSVSYYSAQSGGVITGDGGYDVVARGVCWSTSPNPNIKGSKTVDAAGTGTFESTIDSLMPGTTYYLRAYATNKKGTSYGLQVTFTTKVLTLSELTTSPVTSITTTSALTGGTISIDGGTPITARGVCWSTSQNPTVSLSTKTSNGTGAGSFTSSLTELSSSTTYYVRAYATNIFGTSYGNEVSFTTNTPVTVPEISTAAIGIISTSYATSGGTISSDGGASVTARGVVWSTSQNPTVSLSTKTSNGTGKGSFTSSLTGLSASTTYYARAYATNSSGTAYGNEVSFTTTAASTVSTVNSTTGKVWMDRNLGASRVATSSTDTQAYGDLYQWGRGSDGHEKRTSPTTSTLSNSDVPGHDQFITAGSADWRSPQNNNLWQGKNGINNPCPEGFRIPTSAEWEAELASWNINDSEGAFASSLKLPVAGMRSASDGSIGLADSNGYWSANVVGTNAEIMKFNSFSSGMGYTRRSLGSSVRCIKDK